jgi:5'-3' exonuclease
MGIKGNFMTFLKTRAPRAFSTCAVSRDTSPRIAIDLPIFINKYKTVYGSLWKQGLATFLSYFRAQHMQVWCVFDGKSPPEKRTEIAARRGARVKLSEACCSLEKHLDVYEDTGIADPKLVELNKKFAHSFFENQAVSVPLTRAYLNRAANQVYRLTYEDYTWAAWLVMDMGLIGMTSMGEAERTCANLCRLGIVDAVVSNDSDLLAHLCPRSYTRYNCTSSTAVHIQLDILLADLNMSPQQFVDFCIMCGTDYNKGIPTIGTWRAYKYIQEYKTIECIATSLSLSLDSLNFVRVRELFAT